MVEWLHPGLLLILGAVALPLLKGTARRTFLVVLAGLALVDCLLMRPGTFGQVTFLDLTLTFGRVDRLSLVFSYVFTVMALLGIIYSLHVEEGGQHAAALVYAGSALGAVFAGDLLVLFLFWELMAFSSVFLVWYRREPASLRAGYRYLLVHVAGGASLLAGIVLQSAYSGSLAFDKVEPGSPGSALMLAGFILNAAVPPLSAWLTDAYPEATVTGAVFLSAFTTKTAVYALVRGFPGASALIWLGAVMAVYGVVYATLQNDARRLLAYHIVSQVGYMVAGVGIGTELGLNGSVAHAFAHILYKGLLFMGAGAVLHVTGRRLLSEMGGLHRTMPLTFVLYMVGALSISAWPLTSGFVSKSLVTAAAADAGLTIPFLLLTVASAGTFLSVGLKLPWFMFFGRDAGITAKEPPRNMLVAMGAAAALCIGIGVAPGALYAVLPYPVDFAPYTAHHLVSSLELLLATGLVFFWLRSLLQPKPATVLDTDWLYRRGADLFMRFTRGPLIAVEDRVTAPMHERLLRAVTWAAKPALAFNDLVLDGAVRGVGRLATGGGETLRRVQNGRYHRMAGFMLAGVALMLAFVLIRG